MLHLPDAPESGHGDGDGDGTDDRPEKDESREAHIRPHRSRRDSLRQRVRQPRDELGRAAARLLLDESANPEHRHEQVLFTPELVARASTT